MRGRGVNNGTPTPGASQSHSTLFALLRRHDCSLSVTSLVWWIQNGRWEGTWAANRAPSMRLPPKRCVRVENGLVPRPRTQFMTTDTVMSLLDHASSCRLQEHEFEGMVSRRRSRWGCRSGHEYHVHGPEG